jgi:hypothetical protein
LGMSKWESFLEDHIEGFFNKKFSSSLELVEIIRALGKELVRNKKKTDCGVVVPNEYIVTIGEADYQRFCAQRVLDDLYAAVEKQTILESCYMDGDLEIHLLKDTKRERGVLQCSSRFSSEEEARFETGREEKQHTIVLTRSKFHRPLNLPKEYEIASLRVTEGVDQGSYLAFGEKQIYIGRMDNNDFILTDSQASRLHAYITYERHRHILYDAQSLNGTRLNGQLIKDALLEPGDEIQIGRTFLLYEVVG